jgi:hypothetical protein
VIGMNSDLIMQARLSGRFSEATVAYWSEWLTAKKATPSNLDAFLDFVAAMESDIAYELDELIPSEWSHDEEV